MDTVTLLVTANLGGDIWLLPRLFTLISRERQTASGPVLLLDLGDSCSIDSWVCRATEGRAPLLVLDSMGYDAAWIGGPEKTPIPLRSLERLVGQIMMPLIAWGSIYRLAKRGQTFVLHSGEAVSPGEDSYVIHVDRSIARLPDSADLVPTLGDVPKGGLARVDLRFPEWTLSAARMTLLPPGTPPDPTITAIVELVESEARYYAQQGGGLDESH